MGNRGYPYPGQRWCSHVDGHTVVTLEQHGDQISVRFDEFAVTTTLEMAAFIDDYAFVEWCPTVARAI